VFAPRLIVRGSALEPIECEGFADRGDLLASVLNDAGMALKPRVISVLLALTFGDLRARATWR
jgi:hypothetical protein